MKSEEFLSAMGEIDEKLTSGAASAYYGPVNPAGHEVRRSLLIAAVIILCLCAAMAGSLFLASRAGLLPADGSEESGETSEAVTDPAESTASVPDNSGNKTGYIGEYWEDYLKQKGGAEPTVDMIYSFAVDLWKTGNTVLIKKDFFVETWYYYGRYQVGFDDRITIVPSEYGNSEKGIYLYFLSTITQCLEKHFYYADYDYFLHPYSRYRFYYFYFVQDYASAGAKNAEDYIKARSETGEGFGDGVYRINFNSYRITSAGDPQGIDLYSGIRDAAGVSPCEKTQIDSSTEEFLKILADHNNRYIDFEGKEREFSPGPSFSAIEIIPDSATAGTRVFQISDDQSQLFIVRYGSIHRVGVIKAVGIAYWDYDRNGIADLVIGYDPFSGVVGLRYEVVDLLGFAKKIIITSTITADTPALALVTVSDGDLYIDGEKVTWNGESFEGVPAKYR